MGLISINKKINNAREIVSISLISFVGVSAVISYKALLEQVNGYKSVEKLFIWASAGEGTQYETGVGWVGVTTYNDNSGALRVKKEILVAMSGISTGNSPANPSRCFLP